MIIKRNYSLYAANLGLALISSCNKDKPLDSSTDVNSSENFSYSTTQEVDVNINLKDHTGKALPGQRVNIFSPDLKKQIASGVSNSSGDFNSLVRIPTYTIFNSCRWKLVLYGNLRFSRCSKLFRPSG